MSPILRVLLIVTSVATGIYIRRKLKKSQMQIADVLFWILFAIILIFMSVFPGAVEWLTELLGVISPVNFVFLAVIFLLLVRCFSLSVKVSGLEAKLNNLVEEFGVNRVEEPNNKSREGTSDR